LPPCARLLLPSRPVHAANHGPITERHPGKVLSHKTMILR
jgi:hypothetical protein